MAESPVTMFGVYVKSLSVSLGWGGQGGSMQLTLVEDETNNIVIEKDEDGYPFFGSQNSPQTGSACYFKYGNFYFGGIFQRWTYKEDAVGGRTYDIILESPSKYMDGVWIIMENFNGATDLFANQFVGFESSTNILTFHATYGSSSCYNVFNVFGAYENPEYGPDPYKNFGNSGFRSDGIPISNLLYGMEVLIERNTTEPFGGPIILGQNETGNAASAYGLNMSELSDFYIANGFDANTLNAYSIAGPTKSVNGIIGELAELFQFDYYFDIQPAEPIENIEDGGGRIDEADIHLRISDKTKAPEPNKIREFISEDLAKPDDEKRVKSYTLGKEFATGVTQKQVWGARRSRYLELIPNRSSYACLGKNSKNVSNSYNVIGPASALDEINRSMKIKIEGYNGIYTTTPFELRMSMLDKESWQTFKTLETITQSERNGFNNVFTAPWSSTTDFTKDMLNLLQNGLGNTFDQANTNFQKAIKQWNGGEAYGKLADKIYSGVNNIATTSYKQEYLVRLPSEVANTEYNIYNPTFIDGNGQVSYESEAKKAWDVASSAFIEYGLRSPNCGPNRGPRLHCYYAPTLDVGMFDSAGRLQTLVGYDQPTFPQNYDLSSLGSDYASGVNGAIGRLVSKKGSTEGETYWFVNPFDQDAGSLHVFFKTGCAPKNYDEKTTPDFGLTVLADMFFNLNIQPEMYITGGKTTLQFGVPPDVLPPSYFGIPQESQRFNYGPWVTLIPNNSLNLPGFYSPYGLAEAKETDLKPETYGNYDILRTVGSITAQVANTSMHESESGYVEMVGAPISNLGERFATSGPYITNMDISIDATGGVSTTYKFNTWTPEFSKIAKYNIDRIAKTNKTGWTVAQKNRGLISKPPFPKIKFQKTDFQQLQREKMGFQDHIGPGSAFKDVTNTSTSNSRTPS